MKDTPMIVCPICGSEYLPVEVFIPEDFFGKPKEIMRNEATGKVDFVLGENMNTTEYYTCYGCNTRLKIDANLSFDITVDKEASFEEEYVSSFNKPKKIKLTEVDLFD